MTMKLTGNCGFSICSHSQGSTLEGGTMSEQLLSPNLDVPIFTGEMAEFLTFKDAFDEKVHNTDKEHSYKMVTLLSRLSGPALEFIQQISGRNYSKVYEAMVQKYTPKPELALGNVNSFLNISTFEEVTADNIDKFRLNTSEVYTRLKKLKLPDLGDFVLLALALNKLASPLKEEFMSGYYPMEMPTFEQLENFLLRITERISGPTPVRMPPAEGILQNTPSEYSRSLNFNYPSLVPQGIAGIESPEAQPKGNPQCHMCSGSHWLRKCHHFRALTVKERRSYMEHYADLCRNCLSQTHKTEDCPSSYSCSHCFKRHHLFLHLHNKQNDLTQQQHQQGQQQSSENTLNCVLPELTDSIQTEFFSWSLSHLDNTAFIHSFEGDLIL